MTKFIFYVLAFFLILAAARTITARNSVHAALFLVLAFFSSASLWLLLEAEFLAVALVLVYVGAVVVLFLFVVMMLDVNTDPLREGYAKYLPIGAFVGILMLIEMLLVLGSTYFNRGLPVILSSNEQSSQTISNTLLLGRALYTDYLYAFEIAAIILLVAMIAAIVLTMRQQHSTKSQIPADQVKVKRNERIRLVKMSPSNN